MAKYQKRNLGLGWQNKITLVSANLVVDQLFWYFVNLAKERLKTPRRSDCSGNFETVMFGADMNFGTDVKIKLVLILILF